MCGWIAAGAGCVLLVSWLVNAKVVGKGKERKEEICRPGRVALPLPVPSRYIHISLHTQRND